jgi:phosphate transport system substrate-binding protein
MPLALGTSRTSVLGWLLAVVAAAGCIRPASSPEETVSKGRPSADSPSTSDEVRLSGTISIEGSSTVFPITQAMGVDFGERHAGVQVTVAGNGTGTGFKKLIAREVEICDASRPIAEKEIAACRESGLDYLELQIAIDGLTVVVNKDNDWVETLTVADLRKIWDQGSAVTKWSDLNPDWPDQPLKLFGPGTESGTFDYFTEVINGQARRHRSDYSSNENDNVLVSGVAGNKYALAYFGYAYYVASADKLRAVKIALQEGSEGVAPTRETIESGAYVPLSRPLFMYVNKEALQRPEVAAFVQFALSDEGQNIVEFRKYIRLSPSQVAEMRQRLADALNAGP